MLATIWMIWITVAQPALAACQPAEWALLIVFAASLLLSFAVRERYLLLWSAGWAFLMVARFSGTHGTALLSLRYVSAVEQAAFVLAISLFASAIFSFTGKKSAQGPLAAVGLALAGFAAARAFFWSDVPALRGVLELSYQIIMLAASVTLVRARRGRHELGPWMLVSFLMAQHLSYPPLDSLVPPAVFSIADVALGLSMFLACIHRRSRPGTPPASPPVSYRERRASRNSKVACCPRSSRVSVN